jgi:hypothetical protein
MFSNVAASHLNELHGRTGPCGQRHPHGPRRSNSVHSIGHHIPATGQLVGGDPLGNYVTHRVSR